jgi:phage terminase small subunit
MLELTEKQQKFVVALLETGGDNESRAAMMAGYGTGYETRSYELARNPKVLAAIREEADKRLRSGALLASSKLIEIAKKDTHKDQLKAIIELLNRGGLIVQTQHKVIVEDNRNDNEIIARVAAFARELDIDPVKLLSKVGVDYVDGQFTEVTQNVLSAPIEIDPFADMMTPAATQEDDDDDA